MIGETCVIGEHVKIYQAVTLGAKRFEINQDGALKKTTHATLSLKTMLLYMQAQRF